MGSTHPSIHRTGLHRRAREVTRLPGLHQPTLEGGRGSGPVAGEAGHCSLRAAHPKERRRKPGRAPPPCSKLRGREGEGRPTSQMRTLRPREAHDLLGAGTGAPSPGRSLPHPPGPSQTARGTRTWGSLPGRVRGQLSTLLVPSARKTLLRVPRQLLLSPPPSHQQSISARPPGPEALVTLGEGNWEAGVSVGQTPYCRPLLSSRVSR